MPKSKQTKPNKTGPAEGQTPANPQYSNPLADLSQETRWLLTRQIDEQIAALERTYHELVRVKNHLIGIGIQQANMAANMAASPAMASDPPTPARRRGRPPGSKNKPKPAQEPTPAADNQTDLFNQAVDATRPEKDGEFQAA